MQALKMEDKRDMLEVASLEGSEVTHNFIPGTRITQQGVNEKCTRAESWF